MCTARGAVGDQELWRLATKKAADQKLMHGTHDVMSNRNHLFDPLIGPIWVDCISLFMAIPAAASP